METEKKIPNTIAYYASYIIIGFATGIIGPTLPGLAGQTGASMSGISYLFPILSVGYLFGSYLSGRFFDRIKGHPVMAAAVMLLFVSVALIPLAPVYWLIMLYFLVVGIAFGGVDVGGNTLLIWTHRHGVGPFMVGLHLFYGLGAFIAPMVVGQALKITGGFSWGYWFLAVICIPVGFSFLFLKSPYHNEPENDEDTMEENRCLVFLISLFMFLHVGAELSFGGWIYSYAIKRELAGITEAAFLTSAYWGSIMGGRLITIFIAIKLNARTILTVYLIGCIAATAALLLFPRSVIHLWGGTILLGFFLSALIPMTFAFTGEIIDITGRVTSWLVIGLGAGNLFFPWLIGQFFETAGAFVLPVVILAALILALVLLFVLFGYTRREATTVGP